MIPGEIFYADTDIIANAGRPTVTVLVTNRGDRPIQVGSHFHFFEVNPALELARALAYGMRLDIPSGTAVRFEPGEAQTVSLTSYGGQRIIIGQNDVTNGPTDTAPSKELMTTMHTRGFLDTSVDAEA